VHRGVCWNYGAASSSLATYDTRPGTTGAAASTRTATGPKRVSRQHLTDPDAVWRADAAVGNALTETAQLTGKRHQSMIHRSDIMQTDAHKVGREERRALLEQRRAAVLRQLRRLAIELTDIDRQLDDIEQSGH
jgi:hypothetical protein